MFVQGVENDMIESVIITIFLIFGSIWDVRKKCVPLAYLYAGGIVAVGYLFIKSLMVRNANIWVCAICGTGCGLFCLFLAFVSKEQIGYGDGWIVGIVGMLSGIKTVLAVFVTAMFGMATFSLLLLVFKKGNRKTELPFVPFLLFAYVFVFLCRRL